MRITRIVLFKTESMPDLVYRPYTTHVTGEVIDRLSQNIQLSGGVVTTSAVSSVAANILQPSAVAQGIAPIVNGWKTARYRFMIEVMSTDTFSGSESVSYYIGHTDRSEEAVSLNNHIDPRLEFYINSVHHFKIQRRLEKGQVVQCITPMNDHNQFVYNNGVNLSGVIGGQNPLYVIRPTEVFNQNSNWNYLDKIGVLEETTIDISGSLVVSAEKNNRRNLNPTSYLYDTMSAYQRALNTVYETGHHDIAYQEAGNHLRKTEIFHDVLLTELERFVRDIRVGGSFTWQQMLYLAPDAENITMVFKNENNPSWSNNDVSDWFGSDLNTIAATMISQSVPTLMLETLTGDMRVNFTNNSINGQMIYNIESLNGISQLVPPYMDRLMTRIIDELLLPITMNNDMPLNCLIDASVYGETFIYISVNGLPHTPYIMPTFADNIASPIITQDVNHQRAIINDLTQIVNDVVAPHVRT